MRRLKRSPNGLTEAQLGYLLVAPGLLIISLLAFYPILNTFWLSLHRILLQMPFLGRPFIGLDNYLAIFQEIRFWRALRNTAYFTVVSVAIELVLGLGMALLMHRNFRGRGIVRASVLIPWAIPTAVSAMMWKFIYNDQLGVANALLMKLHIIGSPQAWLGETSTAMFSLIFADVWKTTPFMALLLLAGLQVIPEELYEAARVDGAGVWTRFTRVTLPLLTSTILVALLFRTLDAFRVFDLVWVLTNGGPGNTTETLSVYAYKTLMRYLDFGTGSALAVLTFVCVMLISFFYIKVLDVDTGRR